MINALKPAFTASLKAAQSYLPPAFKALLLFS